MSRPYARRRMRRYRSSGSPRRERAVVDRPIEEHEASADGAEHGITRRKLIQRSALAGGALLWATPVVQALSTKPAAAALTGSTGGCVCSDATIGMKVVHCKRTPTTKIFTVKMLSSPS